MKYIVLGCNGQLGKEIMKILKNQEIECLGYDLPDYDVSNFVVMSKLINLKLPDVVINCAAFNDVDMSELSFEDAYKTNAAGIDNLSKICKRDNVKLVHFSSDYVFDGKKKKQRMYEETDQPNPLNRYGITKYEGEKLAMASNPNMLIFRTSWLYGEGENNFVKKVLQWANENENIKIVNDEFSIPTSTRVVASITIKAINNNLVGLYHLTCTGFTTRYDWAKLIIKYFNKETNVYPVSSKDFSVFAKRPKFSAMSNEKISKTLQIEIPYWADEFIDFMNQISNENNNRTPNLKRIKKEMGITN